jgi:hypothetical protein
MCIHTKKVANVCINKIIIFTEITSKAFSNETTALNSLETADELSPELQLPWLLLEPQPVTHHSCDF